MKTVGATRQACMVESGISILSERQKVQAEAAHTVINVYADVDMLNKKIFGSVPSASALVGMLEFIKTFLSDPFQILGKKEEARLEGSVFYNDFERGIGSGGQFGRKALTVNIREDRETLCDIETFHSPTVEEMPVCRVGLL